MSKNVLNKLKIADIRVEIDERTEKIGKKIRDTELMKVPYMLVIGEREINSTTDVLPASPLPCLLTETFSSFISLSPITDHVRNFH